MKLPRRQFLHLAASAAALPVVSGFASAQTYPSRPVRIIVPVGAAGVTDIIARLVGQWLSERLGQPFFIESRPGAGNIIGTEAVVRAPADGYTLLLVGAPNAINASLYDKVSFDFVRDIAPVASIARVANILVVNLSVPAKTCPEFIAHAKANPGKINMASVGNGSTPHVTGELFKMMAGVDMVHVPYRSAGAALTDLITGQVQVYFATTASSIEHIRAGRLRALAVTSATRSDFLPDVPTVSHFLPGFEASFWGVALARPGTRPPRSSASSIRKSTPASPIPNSQLGLPTWAAPSFQARQPISLSSSPTKPRNGAKWSSSRASSRTDRVRNSITPLRNPHADVAVGRVEDRRGSLGLMANAPFPIPAHRTGRADFRHPALRLASPQGTRRRSLAASVFCGKFPLRLSTQQSRTGPVIDGVLRLVANHLDLPIFESTPEVRVLCSAGITQHRCSYDPVRLPP